MLRRIQDNLEFIVIFGFPSLLLFADMLVRFGLRIDVSDAGADMALSAAATYLTLLVDNLRSQRINRDHLVIMFGIALFASVCWFLALLFVSDSNPLYQAYPVFLGVRTAIVLGIGIGTLFPATKVLYELLKLYSE